MGIYSANQLTPAILPKQSFTSSGHSFCKTYIMQAATAIWFIVLGLLLPVVFGYPIQHEEPAEVLPEEQQSTAALLQATTTTEPSIDLAHVTTAAEPNVNVSELSTEVPAKAKCECAVFNTQMPKENDYPLVSQSPITVACNTSGENNCLNLCSVLAKAVEERAAHLLCSALGYYNHLRASVHSRICGHNWIYTGLTYPKEICCHDHQVIACENVFDNM